MPSDGVYNRFATKDAFFITCTLCDPKIRVAKYSIKGGMSNFGRHIRNDHANELAEVQVQKQTNRPNPFVEAARKRKADNLTCNTDSQDCVVGRYNC